MRVIWFSRHNPLPSQVSELRRVFGNDTEVIIERRPFYDAWQVSQMFTAVCGDEMVIVAPIQVLHDLVVLCYKPIVCIMEADGKTRGGTRSYEFKGFKRIKTLSMETEVL